jgi:pyruvate dehydrogenase E2 component (dihydrolipoamide acetyltransferase)
MGTYLMPSLGADMEAGTLVEWLKAPGDALQRGDVVAVVETQKGAIEIEVFETGILDSYLVKIGDKVPVGTPMAVIRGAETAKPATTPQPVATSTPTPTPAAAEAGQSPPTPAKPKVPATPPQSAQQGPRLRISPAARRAAQTAGLDLDRIQPRGTGPGGAIALADIAGARPAPPPADAAPQTAMAPSGMRAAIAAAMSRSKREIPHYYLSHDADLTIAQAFITQTNASRTPEDRLLLGVLYLAAVSKALPKYPEFNGHYIDGAFRPSAAVHTGMAFTLRGGGLVAPAILDAGGLTLDALMTATRDLATRVRAGRFRASELSDATITISSLGERGVDQLFGVIYPPQVAIVGIGTPAERALVCNGCIEPRLAATLTLAADHRVSDGHRGALFLREIARHLQSPEAL